MFAYLISPRALWRAIIIVIAGFAFASTAAFAMRVSPMVLELSPSGTNSSGRIEVQNTLNQKLAFETKVTRISFNEEGVATEVPADEDFLIFPPQAVLDSGGRQVIRVQYVGDPRLQSSQSYYVSVNQLPVAIGTTAAEGGGAQVQIVYHMKALVVVAPTDAEPNVSAVSARPITITPKPEEGEAAPAPVPAVEVTLRNTGKRHAFMSGIGWRFDGTGLDGRSLRVDIDPSELSRLIGTGYVGPNGGQRIFRIPVPAAFAEGPIEVSFLK